jgi:hypothetical protein
MYIQSLMAVSARKAPTVMETQTVTRATGLHARLVPANRVVAAEPACASRSDTVAPPSLTAVPEYSFVPQEDAVTFAQATLTVAPGYRAASTEVAPIAMTSAIRTARVIAMSHVPASSHRRDWLAIAHLTFASMNHVPDMISAHVTRLIRSAATHPPLAALFSSKLSRSLACLRRNL